MAKNFRRVLATEISRASVELAQLNMAGNAIENVTVARLSSEDFSEAFKACQPGSADSGKPPCRGLTRLTEAVTDAAKRRAAAGVEDEKEGAEASQSASRLPGFGKWPMFLQGLEWQVAKLSNRDTCPRPTADRLHNLLVDPPRSGMDALTCEVATWFKTVVYIRWRETD